MCFFSNALTQILFTCSDCSVRNRFFCSSERISSLLYTSRYGISFSLKIASNSSSHCFTPCVLSITRTAISVRLSICFVFRTRSSPRCPSSSKPGVSIIITGPNGRSSIAFETGSVVVPFVSDTTANSCPVTAFTTLDFPAFLLPKNPICILSPDGVSFKLIKCSFQTILVYRRF